VEGLAEAALVESAHVFVAGAQLEGERVLTSGGRVLGVTALGDTLGEAAERAYSAVDRIRWPGEHHRRDIGWRAL
jgi:phosphoribosylamine--glycine ligase